MSRSLSSPSLTKSSKQDTSAVDRIVYRTTVPQPTDAFFFAVFPSGSKKSLTLIRLIRLKWKSGRVDVSGWFGKGACLEISEKGSFKEVSLMLDVSRKI